MPARKARTDALVAVKVGAAGEGTILRSDLTTHIDKASMQTPAMGVSEPMFNIPRVVLLLAGVMIGMQLILMLLPSEESVQFLLALAFIPARYSGAALELPGGYLTAVTSFVTYALVHAGWVHLLVNLLWMAAFGSPVAKRLGDLRFLSFSALCAIAGAVTHLVFHFGEMTPVVGASAAISGQMAAAMRFVFAGRRPGEADLAKVPLESLSKTLTDRRILTVLAFWVVLNIVFGAGVVSIAGTEGDIAWEAHIGGFLFGLLCFGFFDTSRKLPVPQQS